ncbi:uncharacterized protein LOC130712582 [Lotus japonicus]|uniref:uncharacterized protein LOC130712582 n=1 Tax=Lotus japonicus TaxID=34305 RepID=UPI002590B3D9|nr:uncharacterized protein LOC130712582 [Lotus japonicus]
MENMKSLVLESYNGDINPKDHLLYFNTKMVISAASDAVKCRMFPSTFKSTGMAWFTTLPPRSISNFMDFSSKFLVQFSTNQIQNVTINDLFNIRQREGETLKHYMARFGATSVKVEDIMSDVWVGAFKNGLRPGSLNNKMSQKPATTMGEIHSRAHMYIFKEEDDALKFLRDEAGEKDAVSSWSSIRDCGEKVKQREGKVPQAAKQP